MSTISLVGATLHVADVERSLAFYQRLPGASLMFHMKGRFALLRIGTGRLGLLQDQKRPFHLEVDCADLDATYAELQQLGVATEGPPTTRPWGERDLWVIDPDGYLVEFGQARGVRPPDPGRPPTGGD
jgi:catechol 2,3-dioxygenase-like lactoylglutathione lyase family enzyme